MAEGAMSYLVGKVLDLLGSFALQEVKFPSGVKTEFEILGNTVSMIQAVIVDAEKLSSDNHQIQDWLRKLKDALHDADDLLDDFSTEVLRHKVMTGNKMKNEVRLFFSSSSQVSFSLKMCRELKAIRQRLNVIAKEKNDFHFSQSSIEPQVMIRDMENNSFVLEDEVIGREDDKNEIIERIFDETVINNISVIPIVGPGGMGKTTLAQLVYNDENVKKSFELKTWICVSAIFDIKRTVKEILEQLTGRKDEVSFEILHNRLQEKLNGKKYLIVLDDLWDGGNDKLLSLRDLFMVGARGSRIIVTTCSKTVAKTTGAISWRILDGLSKEQAWSLFVKMAFERGQLPDNQIFISLGKEIVEECGGIPLAIRTIASLLSTKASENEWRSFKNYELSKIALKGKNDILSMLKLSYDHLPSYLKQCFAYCGLIPKGHKIHIRTLIEHWAAQGFIKLSNSKQCFESVGQEYFMVLIWRSFFKDVEKDEWGNIYSCKMHNLMHDLASLMAGTESTMLTLSDENSGEKVRHLAFDPKDLSSDAQDLSKQLQILMIKGRRIRTILDASVGIKLGKLTCDALISNLNYLRTLDLSYAWLHEVPYSIGGLKHLRYLDLSGNRYIKVLPNSITKLVNLQSLKLCFCDSLKELPQGIKKLVNLRYLDTTDCLNLTYMPLGLGYLTSLEILPMFVVRQEGVKVSSSGWYKKKQARSTGGLSELRELSKLGGSLFIRYLGHGKHDVLECAASNMKQKQHLQELVLQWEEWEEWDGETNCYVEMSLEALQPHPNLKGLWLSYYMGVKISSWISSLTNLVSLTLSDNSKLQHLPPLNQLPVLGSISLRRMEALEHISEDSSSSEAVFFPLLEHISDSSSSKAVFFPSLHSLEISYCPHLKGWWRKDDVNEPNNLLFPSFPCLSDLQIRGCPNLTSMPLFPYLKNNLELHDSSLKVLLQTMKMAANTSTSTSSHFPLSQLEYLWLREVDLELIPEEWLRYLVSLQKLSITKCLGLKSLPWIGNLTSLQSLFIHECPNLSSLPQEICNLKSLHLTITDCPLLEQRYNRQTGEDCLNTAHVPDLDVDWNQQEIISGQVPTTSLVEKSNESPKTEESGKNEEETDADIEKTLKAKGIKLEQDESIEDTQVATKSSLPTSSDPIEHSLFMSQTPSGRNEADVLTNTNQDGVQEQSFESVKVSEISELMDLPTQARSLQIEGLDDQEFIPQGQVPTTSVVEKSNESPKTEESGKNEEETDADIEKTLKAKGIKLEQDESIEDTQVATKSSLPASSDPIEHSLLMSQTPSGRNEVDVLTNTNQDGVQEQSFESMKVSEISELMDLPTQARSLQIEGLDDQEFIPQGQVLSTSLIKKSKESSETDAYIETTSKAKGIKLVQDESNEEDPSPSLFLEDKSSLPTFQDPVECSPQISQTTISRNEADVLTNSWSNQDGVQDLSFKSMKVSEISELMDLPTPVHSLKIDGCDDLEFIPEGVMSSDLSLQDLYIINCCSLKSFPEDHPPTALKVLYIRNCKKLNFPLTIEKKTHCDALLEYLCIGSSCDSLKVLSLDLFPNLKSLSIWDCANLQSLSMPEGIQKNLTSLEALEIRDCHNLLSFPIGGLPTPNLSSIWLSNCKNLKKLPDQLQTLNSLQSMFINNCPELESLSKTGLPSSLSLLSITFCNKLRLKAEPGLDGLHYLSRLEIEGECVDVESFPEKLLPSNLSSLRISGLLNLKSLHKGFQQLTALQRLEISCCPNLQSLPEDGFPSSLSYLCIKECSLLTLKFQNKKGKDWSKIAHISCIEIDEEVIS